jgi:outer membrane protein assembly factor BamB
MGRSNLRAKAAIGGYNLVDVRSDPIIFSERSPATVTRAPWTGIRIGQHTAPKQVYRPSYAINDSFPYVKSRWTYASDANVISTPAVAGGLVVFGNSLGKIDALSLTNGKKRWSYHTQGPVYSSPAVKDDKVVLGSCDGYVYCLSLSSGRLQWSLKTAAAVLGNPLISGDTVYIVGSDHQFRAIDLKTGSVFWQYTGVEGPVVSTPVLYKGMVIFGAWDRHLRALDASTGKLIWQWNNGSAVRNYSPASCIPVIWDDVVYIVAPDRFITAIDVRTGSTLWRNNDATVRESIGISADGQYVYGKTMTDTIVAYHTSRSKQPAAWKLNCGFGYEHVPSMLIERDGLVFFGTKNGTVYAIDPQKQERRWAHKIDNSMVNTVRAL